YSSGTFGGVSAWDLKATPPARRVYDRFPNVQQMILSSDGSRLAVAEPFVVGRIGILDTRTGNDPGPLPGHAGFMLGLSVLPDGTLLTLGLDRSVRWWDIDTGRERRQQRVEALQTWYTRSNVRADGRGLFAIEAGDIVHIDLASGATTKVTTEKPNSVSVI